MIFFPESKLKKIELLARPGPSCSQPPFQLQSKAEDGRLLWPASESSCLLCEAVGEGLPLEEISWGNPQTWWCFVVSSWGMLFALLLCCINFEVWFCRAAIKLEIYGGNVSWNGILFRSWNAGKHVKILTFVKYIHWYQILLYLWG